MDQGLLLAINIFLSVSCVLALFVVAKRDIMMLQQNSYRNERYLKWFSQSNESTTPWRLGACIALFLLLVYHLPHWIGTIFAALIFYANFIVFVSRKYKKPLVFTKRAIRIFLLTLLLGLSLPLSLGFSLKSLYLANEIAALVIVLSPVFMILANILLMPYEKYNNRIFYNDAKRILTANKDLIIIGITGSYGKTSTKHFLYHLLSRKYETLMTPGSYNTLLGVVRTIREQLKPYHKVFIVEMGAKQPNDIKEICDLVHPSIGIVTSVGEQHLETFKTVQNVLKTKFELIDSLPENGLAVLNNTNALVAKRKIGNVPCIYYGNIFEANFIRNVRFDVTGTKFEFKYDDEWIALHTPILGIPNMENLTAALIVSYHLGVSIKDMKYACSTMPQVEHRLQLRTTGAGFTIIDDAFNSNPVGAKMALEVVKTLGVEGKKIVVTPGMIELGTGQYDKNKILGRQIGESADLAIIIGEYNRDALLEGLAESKIDRNNVFAASDFNDAQKIMLRHVNKGDIVLYENDLPDTYK